MAETGPPEALSGRDAAQFFEPFRFLLPSARTYTGSRISRRVPDMRKLLKLLGLFVGGLVLLVLLAAFLLPLFIDANRFKPQIETVVEDATGRDLVIEGDLELSVFPWLGVEIGRTRLSQPPGFGDKPFASVESVEVGVRLLPLLQKKLDVDEIRIIEPVIRLQRNAGGSSNWDDLAQVGEQTADNEAPEDSTELPDIEVAGLLLENGQVHFLDAATGQRITATELRVDTGALSLPLRTSLETSMKFDVQQGDKPVIGGALSLAGEVAADLDQQRFELAGAELDAELNPAALDAPLPLSLELENAVAMMASGTATVESAQLSAYNATVLLDAAIEDLGAKPRVSGTVNIPEFNLRQFLDALKITLPAMQADDALTSFTLDARFEADATSAGVKALDASLDRSRLQGSAGISDFTTQAIRFDLAIDQLDADRYLPPPVDEPEAEKATADALDLDSIELPVELLRDLDVDGKAKSATLQLMGLKASNVNATIKAAKGSMRLNPLSADFYEGGYRGDVGIRVVGDEAILDASQEIERITIAPLLQDLAEIEKVSGSVSLDLDTTAKGRTAGDWARSLDGTFKADAKDGAFEGFNLWARLREARAKIRNEPFDASEYPERTEFADLTASGRLVDGVIENDSLVAMLPFLGVQGEGTILPLEKTLDYQLDVTVLDKPELAESMSELRGTTIPVSVTGQLMSPKVRPDIAAALKAQVKEEVQEEVDEKKDELKKKLEDKLKDIF